MEKQIEIKGWKRHDGSYEIITRLREKIIDAEIKKDISKLKDLLRTLITESAPYNLKWESDAAQLEKEIDKIYDDKFWINGKIKSNKQTMEEFASIKTDFLAYCRNLKARLLITFANSKLIPKAETIIFSQSQEEEDPQKREELEALEEVGLIGTQ